MELSGTGGGDASTERMNWNHPLGGDGARRRKGIRQGAGLNPPMDVSGSLAG